MSGQALKILEQIRALPAEDQDWLADQLNPVEDDPEFLAELERRSDEAHAHPERLRSGEPVHQDARRYLESLSS